MADLEFNQKSDAFLSWFKSQPGATFHPDIAIQDLRNGNRGRGIVATADIAPETVLFTIPRNSVICATTSQLSREIPHIFDLQAGLDDDEMMVEDDGGEDGGAATESSSRAQDSWTSLILVMIYEYLQGPASRWKPYFDVLPVEFDTPMFWSEGEVRELQASPVTEKIGKDEAARMIRSKIIPVIHEHSGIFFGNSNGAERLSDDALFQLANRMGSTIMAYAFDLEKEDEEDNNNEEEDEWVEDKEGQTMMGMVPMADILNADAEFNAHVNHGEDFLTVTAIRAIGKGEEVLNYYGPLSNGELLRRYGYITPKHKRYDLVDLPWDLVLKGLRQELGLKDGDWEKLVAALDGDEFEDYFIIDHGADESDSTGQSSDPIRDAELPEDLVEQVKSFLKAVKKAYPARIPEKHVRDTVMYSAILRALEGRASAYGTTLEQDQSLLNNGQISGRACMALEVRIGEKMLLAQASAAARESLNKAVDSSKDSERPPAKRQKIRA